jgi:hypothetical protein
MSLYRCHKIVGAFRILEMERLEDGSYALTPDPKSGPNAFSTYTVSATAIAKHHPEIGWYCVSYPDGYVSFSPAKAFEDGYTKIGDTVGFGDALAAMQMGLKVARLGWNGSGMFAFIQKGYPDGIAINANTAEATGIPEGTVCKFRPYFMLFTAQGDFAHWVPSGSDILATDWVIVTE